MADFRGQCAGEILFKQEGLSGNFEPCGAAWESITGYVKKCTSGSDNTIEQKRIDAHGADCRSFYLNKGKSATLQAKSNGGMSLNYINPVVYKVSPDASNGMRGKNPCVGFKETDVARTLDCFGGDPTCNQGGEIVVKQNDDAH